MMDLSKICSSNFSQMCRICLKIEEDLPSDNNYDIFDKLNLCFQLQLPQENTLPNAFCKSCIENINIVYEFRQLCSYSQQILSNVLIYETLNVQTISKPKKEAIIAKRSVSPTTIETFSDNDTYMNQDDNSQVKKLCTLCGKSFLHLKEHLLRVHSQNKPFHCSKCDRKFALKLDLTAHVNIVHKKKIKLVSCTQCDKKFRYRRDLEAHRVDHTGKKPYKCTLCELEFKRADNLHSHMKKKHILRPEDNIPLVKQPCQFCGKSFTNLRYHTLRVHSDNKPYSCSKCDKKYPHKSQLKEHVSRVHDGIVRPPKRSLCAQCGKTFVTSTDLESHIAAFHTGIKLHKCTMCKHEFTYRRQLVRHIKMHQGNRVRKFACTYCDKKFTLNSTLRSHIRTHTGERPFSCKICQKCFTQGSALKTHMKIHNPEGIMNIT